MKRKKGKQTLMGVAAPTEVRPPALPRVPMAVPRISPSDAVASSASTEDVEWIPTPDDASQLVELEADSTGRVDISDAMKESGAIPFSEVRRQSLTGLARIVKQHGARVSECFARVSDYSRAEIYPAVLLRLLAPVFSVNFIQHCRARRLAPKILGPMDAMRWWHAITAVGLLSTVLITVLLAISGNADAPPATVPLKEAFETASSPSESAKTTDSAAEHNGKDTAGLSPGASLTAAACLPFGAYPPFSWADRIHIALRALERPGICGLFGQSSQAIARLFAETPGTLYSALDGLPHVSSYSVASINESRNADSSMTFQFQNDKLFRILLATEGTTGRIDFSDVVALANTEIEKSRQGTTGQTVSFVDRDMQVRHSTSRGQTELEFADRRVLALLAKVIQRQERATARMIEGDRLLREQRMDEALDVYREAASMAESFGTPFLRICEVHSQKEAFDAVQTAAQEALAVSKDPRVQAEAWAWKSMALLWQGEKDKAIAGYEEASRRYPGDRKYADAVIELKNGVYTVERVARTAARMACMDRLDATSRGLLIRGNFESTESYFSALRKARNEEDFARLEKKYRKEECRQ